MQQKKERERQKIECRHDIGNGEKAECWKDGEGGRAVGAAQEKGGGRETAGRAERGGSGEEGERSRPTELSRAFLTERVRIKARHLSKTSLTLIMVQTRPRNRAVLKKERAKERKPKRKRQQPPLALAGSRTPDKGEREQVSPESDSGNDTAEVPEGGHAEPPTEDKADDAKSLKDSERLQKELSDASQYPRDALLSRWIEARAGRFGAAPASTSSAQSRPFLTHKLKPSPFQNLMAAQELLKTQKDSERVAGKVTTETSKNVKRSSSRTGMPDPACEDEGPQDLSKPRGTPTSQTSDDGSEISDDANKTVGNEMRIVEDESELRELDLSLPSKHRSEGSMKELQTKSEVKSFDFSVLKSPRAKESKGSSKASLSLDDQNAAACLLQLKSSSTPQSPYVVKILSPEPAHQSGSSTLSAQPMRTPFATRAPPLEAAQPIIPSLGLGESRLVTVSSRGMVEGRGLRPVVPPGPEQGRFPLPLIVHALFAL
ncbi:hypothetical protein C7M84_000096 [Penaeus vannamei]|uniref:Uncharacterized protein n=1 Tax=Penaeus vannamei TaxID=6689 RepID=A0A3R7N9U4_PENVA|nr:hypothetical protein C7M84_000096 [Penaeus vannamei]